MLRSSSLKSPGLGSDSSTIPRKSHQKKKKKQFLSVKVEGIEPTDERLSCFTLLSTFCPPLRWCLFSVSITVYALLWFWVYYEKLANREWPDGWKIKTIFHLGANWSHRADCGFLAWRSANVSVPRLTNKLSFQLRLINMPVCVSTLAGVCVLLNSTLSSQVILWVWWGNVGEKGG